MDNEIISFSLAKIERGREKLCKCDPPHYEIDTVNRIVSCQDCGATVDAFDALLALARRYSCWRTNSGKCYLKPSYTEQWQMPNSIGCGGIKHSGTWTRIAEKVYILYVLNAQK